eukprot:1181431-Prorocentrum_minimum.AAC.1
MVRDGQVGGDGGDGDSPPARDPTGGADGRQRHGALPHPRPHHRRLQRLAVAAGAMSTILSRFGRRARQCTVFDNIWPFWRTVANAGTLEARGG